MKVKVKRLNSGAVMPERMTAVAAGFDLYTSDEVNFTMAEGRYVAVIPTGLAFEIPPGYEGQIRLRSSVAKEGFIIPNAPGTIDSDYRGEVKILVAHVASGRWGFSAGERIAQMVITKLPAVILEEVNVLSTTERGDGGFGSTGS